MNYTQANRPMAVTTPLGKDVLLLVGLSGQEAISRLFSFQLDMIAENDKNVAFDKLLGQKISVRLNLPDDKERYISGLCKQVSQGEQGVEFTSYRMEIVPELWKLTKKAQSRIFQQKSVPDILKKVLEGLDVTYEIQGNFHPRDFCVQYRETDFNFASRLMEEEGIFYFFKHNSSGHQMVVANTAQSHPDMPEGKTIIYEDVEGGRRDEDRIYDWEKVQEWRSGKYTLWDHCFELPHKHLEAEAKILDSVAAGTVTHKLKVSGNDSFEIYDYPGEYAQRFDGVQPGGGDRAGDLQKIFQDNKRTVDLRIEEETAPGLVIHGASTCRNFVSGHKFTLDRHFNADGDYVLTSVTHSARQEADYRSNQGEFHYSNSFVCIPSAIRFRPQRLTPKPVVQGTQTAVVVGPKGEEIFTDKYSRVKVQFHWDREGKRDENSSCWIRVATLWAGKQWGMIHIPRIDQEVIVDFLEGDPDQPIIIGSVYNAEQMPANSLPEKKVISGLKTNTHKGSGYNEMSMDDTAGKEKITIHGQYDMATTIEHDDSQTVHNNRTIAVDGTHTETVKKEIVITCTTAHIHVTAATEIQLLVGASKLLMKSDGKIELSGTNIAIDGTQKVRVHSAEIASEADQQHQTKGAIVISEGSATNTVKGGMVMLNPNA